MYLTGLQMKKLQQKIIMQVHDELVLEVKSILAIEVKQEIIRIMESTVSLKVPLIVDAGIGNNWDEAH